MVAAGTVRLRSGESVSALGQSVHDHPRDAATRQARIRALRHGIDLGMTLIDTAPDAEQLVGDAIARHRDDVFLVARVPVARARELTGACSRTLRRLGTDRLDLYLLHGRGSVDLEATVHGLERLRAAGLIRHWGVADFSLPALTEVLLTTTDCAADEVRYDLAHRGVEWDLLNRCRERDVLVLASTPLELQPHRRLFEVAERHGATPNQISLAWLLSHEGLVAIAPAETREQAEEHRAAAEIRLDGHDHAVLDDGFPPPLGPRPLTHISLDG
jgi:diketogulonate reductase-like aldo/keto reductase